MTNPDPSDPVTVPRSRPWVTVLLVVSLALNLAIAGVIAGAFLSGFKGNGRFGEVRELGFGPFSDALSDDDRKSLRRAFVQRAPDIVASRRQTRADIAMVLAALRADPFNADVLRTALASGSARAAERQALGQELIFEHLSAMPAQDRLSFADRLETALTRRGQRDAKRRNDGTPPRP